MFFVIQCIESKTGDAANPVAQSWGVVSKHDTQQEAADKALEVAKVAPGLFYVAEGLTKLEVTVTMKAI